MDRPKHARPATKADETDAFRETWKTFQPCKSEYDGRGSAREAFFLHVWWRGADPVDILDGARWYAHTFKSGQLRLKMSSWLERGMYEDDADKWRAYQARLAALQSEQPSTVVQMAPRPKTKFLLEWEARKEAAGE